MGLPTFLDGLHISAAAPEELSVQLPANIQRDVHRHRVFRLRTGKNNYFVVASDVLSAEDDGEYFDHSLLLPESNTVTSSNTTAH